MPRLAKPCPVGSPFSGFSNSSWTEILLGAAGGSSSDDFRSKQSKAATRSSCVDHCIASKQLLPNKALVTWSGWASARPVPQAGQFVSLPGELPGGKIKPPSQSGLEHPTRRLLRSSSSNTCLVSAMVSSFLNKGSIQAAEKEKMDGQRMLASKNLVSPYLASPCRALPSWMLGRGGSNRPSQRIFPCPGGSPFYHSLNKGRVQATEVRMVPYEPL